MGYITMKWTRSKAIWILEGKYATKYLKALTDKELFDLGVKEQYWHEEE